MKQFIKNVISLLATVVLTITFITVVLVGYRRYTEPRVGHVHCTHGMRTVYSKVTQFEINDNIVTIKTKLGDIHSYLNNCTVFEGKAGK